MAAPLSIPNIGQSCVIGRSQGVVSMTGITAITEIARFTIPGGLMGANGKLRIGTHWDVSTVVAASSTLSIHYGAAGVSIGSSVNILATGAGAVQRFANQIDLMNNNSRSSQHFLPVGIVTGGWATGGAAYGTGAINTDADWDLIFGVNAPNAGNVQALREWTAELFRSA